LAWVAADRAAFVAETVGDPLVVAASLFRMAHAFLTTGHIAPAQEVASAVASGLEKQRGRGKPSIPALSLEGAFHLVLAIASARDNDRVQAARHIDEAREIAAQAHAMRRQIGEALRCLEEAGRLTPEQTRTHRVARAVAGDLIQLSGSRPRPELRELAERFGMLP
jgi:hypothetical protein